MQPGNGKGEEGEGKGKERKGKREKERESPLTLFEQILKGPVSAFLRNRMRKEAEMEVWGKTSAPLMLLHTLALWRAAILGEGLQVGGDSPGTTICQRAFGKFPPPTAKHNTLALLLGSKSSSPP